MMASLRARLLAAVLALTACGLLLVGAITYVEQRSFQYDRVDQQLRGGIGPAAHELGGPDHDDRGGGPGYDQGKPPPGASACPPGATSSGAPPTGRCSAAIPSRPSARP